MQDEAQASEHVAEATEQAGGDTAHYLRAVAELGDARVVKAQGAIYSESGIKLVEQGARVDSRLYERLISHKLREPIDQQLTVEGAVDGAALLAVASELLAQAPLARLLAGATDDPARLSAPLARVPLPSAMAFKLTLMREQQAPLFTHSVEMAMTAVFLGLRSGLEAAELDAVAAAALLHDIGMLHMDPAWRDPGYRLSGRERKHLVAHPVTSMLLVRNSGAYPRAVERAILEHHERHDGSGYPRGLQASAISPLGKVLLLAEVAAAMFEKYAHAPALRLSMVLRMKHRLFDAALVAHLMPLLRQDIAREAAARPWSQARAQGELLAGAVEQWSALRAALPPAEPGEGAASPLRMLDARVQALLRTLTEAGNHPASLMELRESLADDAEGLAELDMMGYEAHWELRSMVDEIHRRWPELAELAAPGSGDAAVAQWCAWVESHPGMAEDAADDVPAPRGESVAA